LSWPTRSCPESASPSCPTFLTRSYSVTMFCMAVLEHTVGSYKSKAPGRFRFRPWSSKANLRPRSRCLSGRPDARWRPSIFLSKTFLILRSPSLCSPVPTVTLEGKISPASLLGDKNANVSVNYMAGWACGFFGLADCMVPQISLGTAKPDAEGIFKIELPDLSADSNLSGSNDGTELQLILRNAKPITFSHSWNQNRKYFARRAVTSGSLRSTRRMWFSSPARNGEIVLRHQAANRAHELVPSLRDSVPILWAYPGLTSGAIVCRPFGAGV